MPATSSHRVDLIVVDRILLRVSREQPGVLAHSVWFPVVHPNVEAAKSHYQHILSDYPLATNLVPSGFHIKSDQILSPSGELQVNADE